MYKAIIFDFFDLMLSRLAIEADEAIFIDDNDKNILGAEAVDIKGVLYTTPENLKNSLNELAIDY